ncbi:helix-turn-helix domain-containing transcriptional regulator [Bradyrhizobium japonicum]|uniref:helix-turn-helix domain-containing transcriptional regulator n=1 Tax=Bradyrhizobium japonicum TaxID=375 RepID=UPI0005769727|nr:transcriptional regulator [Bradyrhizobium japonicum]
MLAGNEENLADLFRDNPAAIATYLSDNFEENDILKAKTALSLVTRSHNVQLLARDAGLRRDTLYRTFGGRIDPKLGRVLRLLEALNVKARITPASGIASPSAIATRISQAFAFDDPTDTIRELSTVVKSQNVTSLARELGIMRTTVYKTFGGTVDPQLSRVLSLFETFRVRLEVVPSTESKVRPPRPKLGRPRKTLVERP